MPRYELYTNGYVWKVVENKEQDKIEFIKDEEYKSYDEAKERVSLLNKEDDDIKKCD